MKLKIISSLFTTLVLILLLTIPSIAQKFDPPSLDGSSYHRQVIERRVAADMIKLYEAQMYYTNIYGTTNFNSLDALLHYGLIDEELATGTKHGYRFDLYRFSPGYNPFPVFEVYAGPINYGIRSGIKSFYINPNGLAKGADHGGYSASQNDPIVASSIPYGSFQAEIDMSIGIRQIQKAQIVFVDEFGRYGTLNELVSTGLISEAHSNTWGAWLTIETVPATKTSKPKFKMWATPWLYRFTAIRSYYADETGVLRAADLGGIPANENTSPASFEGEELIKYVMRTLRTAQIRYKGLPDVGDGNYASNFWQLNKSDLLHFEIANGKIGGYQIELVVRHEKETNPYEGWFKIYATPIDSNSKVNRSFYIGKYSILRGANKNGEPADENDPLVGF